MTINIEQNATHLWEPDHAYYCETGNYYSMPDSPCHIHYTTWGSFVESEGDADMDYNLVFRWDWKAPEEGVMGELTIHWVGQRKALLRSTSCLVHPDEELLVRAWLQPRLDHLLGLWAPLVPGTAGAPDA